MKLRELAEAVGAELVGGELDAEVVGVTGLENAAPGHIAYVEDQRRLQRAEMTAALALIAPRGLNSHVKPLLLVSNPRLAYARALALFAPPARAAAGIHPTAVVGAGVTLGKEVAVGAHVAIGEGTRIGDRVQVHSLVAVGRRVSIGEDSVIFPNVTLYDGVTVGARVVIHAGSVIGSDGFSYVRDGERNVHLPHLGTVVIEDDVDIGANVTIDRATTGATVIGQGTKLDNLVHVGHNVQIGRNCLLAGQVGISGSVVIGDNVVLAGQTGISDHVTLGDGVMAGARAAITQDVPPGMVVFGSPARPRGEQLRIDAAAERLPGLVRTVRELVKRLEELEKRARGERKGERRQETGDELA
jgi:UDP-3-O-[3-hydroxymyristoyl] glucosamine N-acyltransferase